MSMQDIREYPIIMTAEHVAEILHVSKRYAYEIMERSDFPLIRIGRIKRVHRDALIAWLEERQNRRQA